MTTSRIPVSDAMTRKVITTTPDNTMADAAKLMTKHEIGGLVVSKEEEPVGMITERDFLDAVADDKQPSKVKIKDVMGKPLITISPDKSIVDAAKVMQKNKIRKLPVESKGELIGIITAEDIVRIAPREIELLLELAAIKAQDSAEFVQSGSEGECETCGKYTDYLMPAGDSYICPECKEANEGEE